MADRPLRADARHNREKILRAAREAFAESGYNVPLDEIAARADVGPGTVYRHFPAKDALFQAVVAARIEDLIDDARARARADNPGSAFFGFLARIGEEAAAKRDLPDAIAIAGSLQDALNAALDVLLRRAQESGAVRADIGTADLIVLLKGMLASVRDASPGAADPALRDRIFAILTDGLRQPAERIPKAGEPGGPDVTVRRLSIRERHPPPCPPVPPPIQNGGSVRVAPDER